MTTKSFIKTIGEKGLLADYNSSGKKLQTELIAGDNITIDGNTISSDQLFVASYGTTSYTEVKAAYDAGKICMVKNGDSIAQIYAVTSNNIRFIMNNPVTKSALSYQVNTNNTWSTVGYTAQDKLTFDTTPTANSTNPVTSGGIYKSMYTPSKPTKPSVFTKDGESYSFVCRCNVNAWSKSAFEGYAYPADYQVFDMIRVRTTVYDVSPTDSAYISFTCGKRIYDQYNFVQAIYNGYCYVFATRQSFYPLYIIPNKFINTDMNSSFMTQEIFETLLLNKINPTIDDVLLEDTPKNNSKNPITSGGVKSAIDDIKNTYQKKLTFDTTPTAGSTNPVTSDGVANINGYKKLFTQGTVSSTVADSIILFYIKWKSPTDSGIYNRQYEINYSNFKSGTSGTIKIAPNITNPTGGSINLVSDRFNFNDISFGVIEAPDGDSNHPYWFVGYGYGVGGSIEIIQNGRKLTYTDRPVVVPKEQILTSSCNFTKTYSENPKYYTYTLYPPTTGTFVLKAVDGAIRWVSE